MERTIEYIAYEMSAMKYYNNEDDTNRKRQDMIDNKNNEYIATRKNDGDWSLLAHFSKGHNLIRSRSISKVTGQYGDYTDKVPHVAAEMDTWPDNTVVLAELCWDENGTNANTVGTILRCLPAKAVERQADKKLKAVAFDMLMYNGKDLTNFGYFERLVMVLDKINGTFIYPTEVIYDNFAENADRIITNGGEGIVIQRKDYEYSPGSRTAWKTLKLKQQLPEMELKVVGTIEPNKYYEGDCPEAWKFWEYAEQDADGSLHTYVSTAGKPLNNRIVSFDPITKPYAKGWKNGVIVQLPDGTTTSVASGLTDEDRAWLATDEAAKMIAAEELYAVVKAMSFNDKGRLRHPSLIRLRNDL